MSTASPPLPLFAPPPSTAFSQAGSFPLAFVPKDDYHKSKDHARWFGANRDGGKRLHAGCDLLAREGTRIFAVADGKVLKASATGFYTKREKETGRVIFDVGEVEIRHPHCIARYCEIKALAPGVASGQTVVKGQHIAIVGKMRKDSMLHFELYEGSATGKLTDRTSMGPKAPFQRRADLIDPTPFLDAWKMNLPKG